MDRPPTYSVFAIGLAIVLLSCRQDAAPQGGGVAAPRLRTDAATVCNPRHQLPLVLELPAGGGFWLNKQAFDSAGLARWFQDGLAQRDPVQRLVFVRADSLRAGELRWLIPAIEAAGGGAYRPDSACLRPRYDVGAPAA